MKNPDMPKNPTSPIDTKESWEEQTAGGRFLPSNGLTKREYFCLHMGVAETGDSDLDKIIKRGNKQKAAMYFITGFCRHIVDLEESKIAAIMAHQYADDFIDEMDNF